MRKWRSREDAWQPVLERSSRGSKFSSTSHDISPRWRLWFEKWLFMQPFIIINNLRIHGEGTRKPGLASVWQPEFSPAVFIGPRPRCHLTFKLAKHVGISYQHAEPKNCCDHLERQISIREKGGWKAIKLLHVLEWAFYFFLDMAPRKHQCY